MKGVSIDSTGSVHKVINHKTSSIARSACTLSSPCTIYCLVNAVGKSQEV